MIKSAIKKYLPSKKAIQDLKLDRFFGSRINDKSLWSLSRTSIARAMAIGLFSAFLPIPFQMFLAAFLSIWLRGNLALSIVLVWISNPLTLVIVYTPPYLLGLFLTGHEISTDINFSMDLLSMDLLDQYLILWVGCLVTSTVLAVLGYFGVNLAWRIVVHKKWLARRKKKGKKSKS